MGEVLEKEIGFPASFELLSPASADEFSVSMDDVVFTWEPVGAEPGAPTLRRAVLLAGLLSQDLIKCRLFYRFLGMMGHGAAEI